MHKKSTIILISIILLLIAVIGTGIWFSLSNQQAQGVTQDATEQSKTFTMNEVSQHKSKDDCWTTISGGVYDLTEFANRHPGGDEILRACGADATSLFTQRQTSDGRSVGSGSPHSQTAQEQLARLKIGTLAKGHSRLLEH